MTAEENGRQLARAFRRAAERARNFGGFFSDEEAAMWTERAEVVEALLPPADDGEPVTPDDIRALLPPTDEDGKRGVHVGRLGPVEWFVSWGEFNVWVSAHRLKLDGITKGQFRALCAGLGVTLKEGA